MINLFIKNNQKKFGFTLIETLVGVAVFLIISVSAYEAYVSLFKLINQNQYKIIALNLANEQFEIIRNMKYSDVGIVSGIPNGKIPHVQNINRSGINFTVTTTIRNVDLPFDGTLGGSPNDLSPADNKMAEIEVDCPQCASFLPVTLSTTVAPKNLETASTNGALIVRVFDANGVGVSDANVHIENNKVSPPIIIDDVTDNYGILQIVDTPPGVEAYEITVTKEGYTTDRTYKNGALSNPNPLKPHATVVLQSVTQISFSIDKKSGVNITSLTPTCAVVPNIDFNLTGSKLIGQNVNKYSANLSTNASGKYTNSNMEWDTYNIIGSDGTYDIVGVNPLNLISINPDITQDINLIVMNKNPKSILVTVKDSVTGLPVTDATVKLTDEDSKVKTQITDRGFINQTDWSGGEGVDYTSQDGSIDTDNPQGELKLKKPFEVYNSNGVLISNTFDTGSVSNFHNIIWSPSDEPVLAGSQSVKFQIASSASSTSESPVWNYVGPDGTASTFYTVSDSPISNVHNGHRYFRYKLFMQTEDNTVTPNISDISFTMTSSCTPPGQVLFSGLESGTYKIDVTKTGYAPYTTNINLSSNFIEQEVILQP